MGLSIGGVHYVPLLRPYLHLTPSQICHIRNQLPHILPAPHRVQHHGLPLIPLPDHPRALLVPLAFGRSVPLADRHPW